MTTQNKIQAKNNTSTLVGTNPLIENIRLTKWTANHPVTKELSLQDDGTIKKISTASQLYEGTITKIECTPMEFVEVLMNIGPNDSLSYAQPKDESAVRIMSRKKYAAKGNPE